MRPFRSQLLPFTLLLAIASNIPSQGHAAELAPPAPVEATETAADSTKTDADMPYRAHGSILAIRGSSLVLLCEETASLSKNMEFEVYVELPGNLGTAIIAQGRIATAEEGLLIGKITSQDQTAKLSTEMKVRFLGNSTDTETESTENDDTEKTTAESKTADPDSQDFRAAVENYKQAVLLVKDAQNKSHGTAFVISKKHRLLVTNAHVADIAHSVVLNETRTEYKVVRRWFHPDTIRTMREDNQTVIKSADPAMGPVDPRGTDLAVLQLEMIGPELPAEVVLADPAEAKTIVGAEIGMYGYPGYNTRAAEGQFAQATFVKGTISRLEKLNGHPGDQPLEDRRRVVYDGPNYPGFSGSPIFLAGGSVVVINNSVLRLQDGTKVAYGIRVDALWDMLGHFQLAEKLENAPATLPQPIFIEGQNPQVEKLLTAKQLVAAAQEQRKNGQLNEALENLKQAETTAPWYWAVYYERAKLIDDFVKVTRLTQEDQAKLYNASLGYYGKAGELHLKSFKIHALPILLDYARQSINSSRFGNNKDALEKAVKILGDKEVVKVAMAGNNAAYFLALRATVKKDLGMIEGALADINEAIRLQPGHQSYETERASIVRKLELKSVAQAGNGR